MAFTSSPRKLLAKKHTTEAIASEIDKQRFRAVTFSSDAVETSIGGTKTFVKVKAEPSLPVVSEGNFVSLCLNSSATKIEFENKSNIQGEMSEAENKENIQKMETPRKKKSFSSRLFSSESACYDEMFASPTVRPGRTEPDRQKENKNDSLLSTPKHESLSVGNAKYLTDLYRRTSEDYLDQVADCFVTPPPNSLRRHTLESKLFSTPDCYRVVQMETPSRFQYDPLVEESSNGEDSCSVTVAVRVRPYSQRELSDPNVKRVVSMNGNESSVTSENGTQHRFTFDFSFWSFDRVNGDFADQARVYNLLAQPLLGKAFEGYNTCLFAYGQTGSGKSYSIMGHGSEVGIIPRFCEELFCRAVQACKKDQTKVRVEISFFEIYNEKIHDLLASSKDKNGKKTTLKVREHPVLGPYVEGLSTFVVNSFEDVEGWITLGTKNRATAATGMNDKSSRSHSVFTIVLTQTKTERVEGQDHDHSITSKINLVDLAGSERQSQAQTSGERLREGANINKSLMTLGKVISLLSERSVACKKRKIFIPYRDSVLTWLLKESLGGNSKTAMIATISPSHHHVEETLSTLRYARQTRSIVNLVHVNEDTKAKIIRELRAEIDKLRSQSGTMNEDAHLASLAEIAMLREKLSSKEKEMDEMSRSWQERLRQAEERKLEESKQLERSGVAFKVDNQLPNLVNLNEDPQLSELLLYIIKTGQTRVGQKRPNSTHDIQLSGALIADNHCIINNMEGIINITPVGDAPTYVNGSIISEPTILHHGDRVVLGGDHYFRLNHPMEVKKGQKYVAAKDFEFARQELLRVQEAKLQAELLEAQKAAQTKMEEEVGRARHEAELELQQQRTGYEDKLAGMEKTLKAQSLEVQKAEQSRREAHNLIQDLRKQKMILEQEVLLGRKRQQLEDEANKKVTSTMDGTKSQILELLETELCKVTQRLAETHQRFSSIFPPKQQHCTQEGSSGSIVRKDLYKVALLLREANKISQDLKKNLVFSREDVDEIPVESERGHIQTRIKVTNTHHHIFTHWSVSKLEDKIIQMRDLYQNDSDSSADDDEVFNDPEDTWEKENLTPFSSPLMSFGHNKSPLSSSNIFSSQANNSLSSAVGRRVSFSLSPRVILTDMSLLKICKKLVTSAMDNLNVIDFEKTVADKILSVCEQLRSCISSILHYPQYTEGGSKLFCPEVELYTSFQLLASHCSLWAATLDPDAPVLGDLANKMSEHVRIVGVYISRLLQGCEIDQTSLVQEAATKLKEKVLDVCRTTGELALATKTHVLHLEQSLGNTSNSISVPQLSPEVCQAFLNGCGKLLDQTLQGGIQTLESCGTRAQALSDTSIASQNHNDIPQHVELMVSNAKILLQNYQEIQVHTDILLLKESSSETAHMWEEDVSYHHHYYSSYCRLLTLLCHVSNLIQTAVLLVNCTETVLKGENQNFQGIQQCAELIQRAIFKSQDIWDSSCILDYPSTYSLSSDYLNKQTSPSEYGLSDLDSIFLLSELQMQQLDFAAQEIFSASQLLIADIQKLIISDQTGYI